MISALLLAIFILLVFNIMSARAERRHRLVADLPASKTSGVFVGLVEISGQIETESPLTSHLTQTPCVWYRWSVSESWSRQEMETTTDSEGHSTSHLVTRSGSQVVAQGSDQRPSFMLRDDHGTLRIQPLGADIRPLQVFQATCTPSDPRYFALGPAQELTSSNHRRVFEETALMVDARVCVIGQARERKDAAALEIARDDHAPLFVISIKDEQAVATGFRWQAFGWAFGGLAALVIGACCLLHAGFPAEQVLPLGLGAVAAFLLVWFCCWLLVAYNSLIELRQRVQQAWANVDVQLKRRADLIPNLVSLVDGLRNHEHDVQVGLAHLRTQLVATAPGQAGPDPSSCAPALRSLAERYPALTADRAFATLASALEDCEERIALASTYFNDIATFLNTRLQTGFGILLTSIGGFQLQSLLHSASFPRRPEPAPPTGPGR